MSKIDWDENKRLSNSAKHNFDFLDAEEAAIEWDWDSAKLVMPQPKQHINLRVDADVLRFFKNQGKGYQTRINAVLRSYMVAHQEKRP